MRSRGPVRGTSTIGFGGSEVSADADWRNDVARELAIAHQAWREGTAGMGRVASRRAAGFAVRAWVTQTGTEGYGRTLMNHLGALADDESAPIGVRESGHRLAARKVPAEGFVMPFERGKTTPMDDVDKIVKWVTAEMTAA